MDDLHEIGTLLAKPEPSRDVIDRRRHQLQNAMRRTPVRRRRIGWLTGGLALTAVAAAVAVVVASGATLPTGSPAARRSRRSSSPPGRFCSWPPRSQSGSRRDPVSTGTSR
ncbi:hypothetical protein ACFQX6_40700 [Streptosporangium lutulentum]